METVLITKAELAQMLHVSIRTIDRLRSAGVNLGEVRLTPISYPRFDPTRVSAQILTGKFKRRKK